MRTRTSERHGPAAEAILPAREADVHFDAWTLEELDYEVGFTAPGVCAEAMTGLKSPVPSRRAKSRVRGRLSLRRKVKMDLAA